MCLSSSEQRFFPPGYLFVWIDVDVAFDTLLPHVGPGVAAHPLPLTLGALVLSEAPLLALVGGQSFPLRPGLGRKNKRSRDLGRHLQKEKTPKPRSRAEVLGGSAAVVLMYVHTPAVHTAPRTLA